MVTAFFHAFGGVFSLILVVSLGYALGKPGKDNDACRKILPRFITNVTLPPFLACIIINAFQKNQLLEMLYGIMAPLLGMALLFAGAFLVGKLIRVEKMHFGLFCVCVSNPNTIFIGIPINIALFSEDSLPYVLLYYFASTLFFWTVGNYFISRDATREKKAKSQSFRWNKIISPPLIGFMSGVIIICLDVTLPHWLMQSAQLTGQLTTPLALIFIGLTLRNIGLKNLKITRDILTALMGRLTASPLLFLFFLPLFPLPRLMKEVFVIQSCLPVILQAAILSAYYNSDPEFGSEMVALSTIFCILTVPFWNAILGIVNL